MQTYTIDPKDKPLYMQLYRRIRADIQSGNLISGEKLPSKRTLANHLGVSTITIENAYNQLVDEGLVESYAKKGYFVTDVEELFVNRTGKGAVEKTLKAEPRPEEVRQIYDFSSNRADEQYFPFSIFARIIRQVLAERQTELVGAVPSEGIYDLRREIALHLRDFRGMQVEPDQIVVGAGTEYLYGILVQLLGRNLTYCIENPGYTKLDQIYRSNGLTVSYAGMDEAGILPQDIRAGDSDVVHISPAHHFPTGIIMPLGRRREILAWANEASNRYIIEDDYDSEFRMKGRPLPTMQSIDQNGKVIYMNTFSKSLAESIRVSYMVLPSELMERYREELSFLSCTVPALQQYMLSEFMRQGYFEKHINRMRLYYIKKRSRVLEAFRRTLPEEAFAVSEQDAGLHFLLCVQTKDSDFELERRLLERGIKMISLAHYAMDKDNRNSHMFLVNYSNLDEENLEAALEQLRETV